MPIRKVRLCRQRVASAWRDPETAVVSSPGALAQLKSGRTSDPLYLRDTDLPANGEPLCIRLLREIGDHASAAELAPAAQRLEAHVAALGYREGEVRELSQRLIAALDAQLRRRLLVLEVLDLAACDVVTLLVIHNLLDEERTHEFIILFTLPNTAALTRVRRANLNPLAARLYHLLELAIRTKQWVRAGAMFECLLRLKKRLHDPRLLGLIHFRAGMGYVRAGRLRGALKSYKTAQRYLLRADDQENLVKVYNNIGNIYIDLGRYRAALTEFSRTLAIAEEFQNDYSLAVTFSSMGNALLQSGDAAAAIDCQKKSLLFAARSGYFARIQVIYSCLANAYSALGQRKQAERLFHEAYAFALQENERYDQYTIKLALARHYLVTGDTRHGEEALRTAEQLCTAFKNRFGLMQILDLHGDFAGMHHRWPAARLAYRKALRLARELQQPRFVRQFSGKLAGAEREQKRG